MPDESEGFEPDTTLFPELPGQPVTEQSAGRARLTGLLGEYVTVTSPSGSTWTGRLIAIADDPSILLEQDYGHRPCLPQSFTVTEAPAPAAGAALPDGEYARVEILGHDHHTGWVTESTRAGQPVMVVRNWEGFVIAEVPGHSLYRFVPLPTPQKRPDPEQRRALPSGWGDDDDDYAELPADSSPF